MIFVMNFAVGEEKVPAFRACDLHLKFGRRCLFMSLTTQCLMCTYSTCLHINHMP